jgi:hypothetical protein
MHGGSYTEDVRDISYDLTALRNVKNGKPLDFGQNVVTFDKQQMARYYTFEWTEEVTPPFEGPQIEVDNKATDGAKTETIKVEANSDIDYMFMYPQNFSNDGLALIAGVPCDPLLEHGTSTGTKGVNDDVSTPLYGIDGSALYYGGTLHMTATGSGQAVLSSYDVNKEYIGDMSFDLITENTTEVEIFNLTSNASEVAYIGFRMLQGSLTFNVTSAESNKSWMVSYKTLTYIDQYGVERSRNCQNGICAMTYLQPNFLTYQMPASNLKINGVPQTAKGLSKQKKQEVTFPIDAVSIDTNSLIKTSVGFGEITKISLNLSSRTIKATLAHDTNIQ